MPEQIEFALDILGLAAVVILIVTVHLLSREVTREREAKLMWKRKFYNSLKDEP